MKLIRILSILAFAALCFTGCKSIDKNADPVVVNAERTLSIAFSTFDTFLKLEKQNQATVKAKAPKVHTFAEWLREKDSTGMSRGLSFIKAANEVKQAYKHNRTAENRANLVTALAVLQASVDQAPKPIKELK